MENAPFFEDIAGGPRGGAAYWLRANDGVRIRVGLWPAASDVPQKGTVFLFPGRTEYIEKYGPAAGDLATRGYATFTIDWRGQGLADRACQDRNLGHVEHFDEYQHDLTAMIDAAAALDLPRPYYLMAHSMGGCIGLRALHRDIPFHAAAFSAPMWGIFIAPTMRPFAWGLSWFGHHSTMGQNYAPGTIAETYVNVAPFDDNLLTTDRDMYAFMQRHAKAYPDLMLGGPSLSWLYAALTETRDLRHRPAPTIPVVTFMGTHERIVDTDPVHDLMAVWKTGRLEMVEGAEHEVLMEGPATRARFFGEADALFSENR